MRQVVWHSGITFKLQENKISGKLLNLVLWYSMDKLLIIAMAGVPQESILSLL